MNPCARVVVPKGYVRRRNSLQWTLALLVTSIMLYLPANILPIMVTDLLGPEDAVDDLAGVILLWSEGSYPVAAGDLSGQYYGANVKDDRHRVAVLGCQRAWQARQ